MKPTVIKFVVYPGDKGEKKHSRRYYADAEDAPISDIYVKRPFSNGKDMITITIEVTVAD